MKKVIGILTVMLMAASSLGFVSDQSEPPVTVKVKDSAGAVGEDTPLNVLVMGAERGFVGMVVAVKVRESDFSYFSCPLCISEPERISTNELEYRIADFQGKWQAGGGNFEIPIGVYHPTESAERYKPRITGLWIQDDGGFDYEAETRTGWMIRTGQ